MKSWAVKIFNGLIRMVGVQAILTFVWGRLIYPRLKMHVDSTPETWDNSMLVKVDEGVRAAIKNY